MVHLLGARRHFRARAPVDDHGPLGAEALGGARGVHRHVAAAHDRDAPADEHRRVSPGKITGIHQVDARQVFVGGVNALQILARHVHEHGQARTVGDEDRVKALAQLGQRVGAADDDVALDRDAGLLQALHLLIDNALGQAKLGDAVDEHAAGLVQRLVDRDAVALFGQFAGGRQPGRAGADDGHLFSRGRGARGARAVRVLEGPVSDVAFKMADGHRLALPAAHALDLALRLLRAHAAGHAREGVVIEQTGGRARQVAPPQQIDEARDVHAHRAAGDATRILALDAALGLEDGDLFRRQHSSSPTR